MSPQPPAPLDGARRHVEQVQGEQTRTHSGKRGVDLLRDPSLNKSTAFTEQEKQALGLIGLVPDKTETEDLQLYRVMLQLGEKPTDLER